ncbi:MULTISPECIES: Ig-like domain repeat protein [Mumia]|uniref:Ig-like domain repeat protein n=1 Tax=Mumia xiangluensis TaxID=1678900 RepID=A0ABW1QQN8_9ACTN|nr:MULTISPECIES: Ig-like domain repeat protein [Mumia]
MLTLATIAPRRALAGLMAVLLAVGILAAAPAASAATTLTYVGDELSLAEWKSVYLAVEVGDGDATGAATATVAGKTYALKRSTSTVQQNRYELWATDVPVGVHTVRATFTPATGSPVTTEGVLEVDGPLLYPTATPPRGSGVADREIGLQWQVSPTLRSLVLAEGGTITFGSGAKQDTEDPTAVRFPIVDTTKAAALHRVVFGGTVRFTSPKRDVTVSDVRQVETSRTAKGSTFVLQADVTYRHPGVPTRTVQGLTVANLVDGIGGAGDPWYADASTFKAAATAAGATALATTTGSSLGTTHWRSYWTDTPPRITGRMVVNPGAISYGRTSRVSVTVARPETYATGTVTFRAGSRSLGTVRLSRGAAAVAVPAGLAVGSHAVTASYKADYSPTTATARTSLRITKAGTVTKAALAKKKVTRKQRAKVTVTVAGRGTTIRPTGTVKIYDGKKRISTATLTVSKRGKVTVKLPKLKKRGKHTLRIAYGGSSAFSGSSVRVVLRVR